MNFYQVYSSKVFIIQIDLSIKVPGYEPGLQKKVISSSRNINFIHHYIFNIFWLDKFCNYLFSIC